MNKDMLSFEGEWDYDYVNDIMFFKVKNREYSYSIELKNMVIDVDSERLVTGLQIFGATKLFNLDKDLLRQIKNWKFEVNVEENTIELKLFFNIIRRNKVIIEKNPILIQSINREMPNSKLTCSA